MTVFGIHCERGDHLMVWDHLMWTNDLILRPHASLETQFLGQGIRGVAPASVSKAITNALVPTGILSNESSYGRTEHGMRFRKFRASGPGFDRKFDRFP